ncbi:enamine deaminase RidA [Raoultella ornithinolytica]|jgi:enamine deaminase RidA (YjgF/YER057c/UK114 family)|uniref:RidA family protein n=1 Tax=Raoultella ornithinolytica TaxID=54291 RepID=A0A1Y6GMB5_RAOOR|nr:MULTISPECIES: RidA family protein [Raoultella]AGJ87220.1 putative translation initiation inhibitor, yjgF family protein [Raoultella ornithinolytica B6]ALQ48037.1 YoaB-like protein [Raoultella ornithinolytica]ANZ04841.1 endoribonuclease L-PSP [Raoultella ornithinolytica]AOO57138.1 endoribonuclease L-PSP [Raoultella ornithinolytica]ASI57204.1 RidA family protein [Raoultella ornithinolytica]
MRDVIHTGLPDIGQPFSWATRGGGMLFTAHGPVRADGTIETGPAEQQIALTFDNLTQALQAAGSHSDNVLQVIIYLTDVNDVARLDDIYQRYFNAPYPNRSTVIVDKLVVPGMKIEITVSATA